MREEGKMDAEFDRKEKGQEGGARRCFLGKLIERQARPKHTTRTRRHKARSTKAELADHVSLFSSYRYSYCEDPFCLASCSIIVALRFVTHVLSIIITFEVPHCLTLL